MRFILLVYTDDELLGQVPQEEFNTKMAGCLAHNDVMRAKGQLVDVQQLEAPKAARSMRVRRKRLEVRDGPFAETKEVLAGFNLIEAADMDEALRIAQELPWAEYGCIEVRPVKDLGEVARAVGKT